MSSEQRATITHAHRRTSTTRPHTVDRSHVGREHGGVDRFGCKKQTPVFPPVQGGRPLAPEPGSSKRSRTCSTSRTCLPVPNSVIGQSNDATAAAAQSNSNTHVGVATCGGTTCHGRQEADGAVVRELDEAQLRVDLKKLHARGEVQALTICFIKGTIIAVSLNVVGRYNVLLSSLPRKQGTSPALDSLPAARRPNRLSLPWCLAL